MKVTKASLGIGDLHFSNSPARRHTKKQLRKAVHMFAEQGIISPIVVDRSYRIIDGHLRVMATRELGIEALDALVLPDISGAQRIELELALNRLPEDSTWDAANLKNKIEQLIEYNVDLTFTGFETAEIDKILSFEVIEPDDQDWTASDPVTQFGDIWKVGDHVIACGNALAPDEVLGDVLDGLELARACITDPPYNVPTVGRPKGSRNKATIAIECLLQGQSEALTQTAVTKALEGDSVALRLCMERVAPAPKDQPVSFRLPKMKSALDASEAAGSKLTAVSEGELTPIEATRVMGLIDSYRRTLELTEIEERLQALETN